MTIPLKSQGTTLHISSENADETAYASATFVKVGHVVSIGEPSGSAQKIDVSHLESEAKEFDMGLPDNGDVEIGMNALTLDTGQTELFEAKELQDKRHIKITRKDGSIRHFKAYVLKMNDFGMGVDSKVPASATLAITGGITRVPAPVTP